MRLWSFLLVAMLLGLQGAHAQLNQLNLGQKMGIDQKLGDQVPLDVPVKDEHGNLIKLGDVFHGRPVVFMPIFYTCKGVCGIELSNILKSAIKMKATFPLHEKYDVVALSIFPKETPDLALAKERELQDMYDRPQNGWKSNLHLLSEAEKKAQEAEIQRASQQYDGGWHLLTGSEENIRRVTDALGFRYEYNPVTDQINHPSGIMILTPQGKVSSYIYGADYPTKTLQESLSLASVGKVGAKAEVILLGCIMVDPVTGKRTIIVENVMKIAGILTVLILAFSILKMSLSAKKAEAAGGTPKHA